MSKAHHEDLTEEIAALFDENGNIDGSRANGRFAPESELEDMSSEQTSPEQCAEWRRRLHRTGVEQQTLARNGGVHPSTVHYHVHGRCSHVVDEPELEESRQ